MESVSEEANCRRVRVLRWNEKLSMKEIMDCDAFLMLRITNKFITKYEEIRQRSSDVLLPFARLNLLSHHSFKSLIIDYYPYLSQHLLPNTILSLAPQISTYLFSRFRFTPQNLLLRNQPRIVILVEIDRTRTVNYSTLFPPRRDYLDEPILNWDDDEEEKDLFNTMMSLCYKLGDHPLKPIADDEPVGFFEVDPKSSEHVWVRRRDEAEAVVGLCPICLDVVSTESRPIDMVETPCLHVFHESCLSRWRSKSSCCSECGSVGKLFSSCPTCRFVFSY